MKDFLFALASLSLGLVAGCDRGGATSAPASASTLAEQTPQAPSAQPATPTPTPPSAIGAPTPSPLMVTLPRLGPGRGVTYRSSDVADWTPVARQGEQWLSSTGVEVSESSVIQHVIIAPDQSRAVFIQDLGCEDLCHQRAILVDATGAAEQLTDEHPSAAAWHPSSQELAIELGNEDGGSDVAIYTVEAGQLTLSSTLEGYTAPSYRPDGTLLVKRKTKTYARGADGTLKRA